MENVPAEIVPQMVAPLSAVAIRAQVNLIQQVMKEVMQVDQHYGVVPGCGKKPTLLKPGAEKLAMTFRLRPIMDNNRDIRVDHMENGHREITVYCHIFSMSGIELATGIGSCSTMETKYRYRNASDYDITGDKIPADYRDKKQEYRKKGFGAKQIDGIWEWVKYKSEGKTENPDIADTYNTVLKMAKKRAFVDGILSATGASDIFTQDIEDLPQAEHHAPAQDTHTTERKGPVQAQPTEAELKAAQERARATLKGSGTTEAPKDAPAKSQTSPQATKPPQDGPNIANGFIYAIHPANLGGYKVYELDNEKGPEGYNKRFATNDPDIIQTIEAHHEKGERVSWIYTIVPWKKGAKSGLNYTIQELIAAQEPIAQPGD